MVIDERRMIVRLKRWLTTRRQRPRQAHRGPAAARLPALIAKAADGDKWALRELAGIVVPFVNYYCRIHLGTTETAQQVAQGIPGQSSRRYRATCAVTRPSGATSTG